VIAFVAPLTALDRRRAGMDPQFGRKVSQFVESYEWPVIFFTFMRRFI
jgi:hypothetical protein